MTDNINVTQGSGTEMATDLIGSVHHPRVKVQIGEDGAAQDVSELNPMPISGTVTANTGFSQPLTDTELRASAVPVSVSGVATSSLQTTGNNSLSLIDSKLPSLSNGRVPVDVGGATVNITGPVTVSNEVEIKNDSGNPIPVSGTIGVNNFPATQAVTGPLTDTQLRASAVPISGTVTANTGLSQPLTDAQLRATVLPVSVSGVATAANQESQTTELQAIKAAIELIDNAIAGTEMQVDVVSSALPTGAATSANQTTANNSLSSIDGKLPALAGGRVPVDIGGNGSITVTSGTITVANTVEITNDEGSPIPVSGTVTANTGLSQPLTDAQLRSSAVPVSGPLTDTQLRATAVPVSATSLPLPTGAATETTLASIDTKTPALDNSKQPVVPSMTAGGNLSVQTAAVGTNWTAFASQALKQLTVSNQTETNIEFRQDGAGVGLIIPSGSIFTFFGITNANQIEAKRVDNSNTQVTVTARWES